MNTSKESKEMTDKMDESPMYPSESLYDWTMINKKDDEVN